MKNLIRMAALAVSVCTIASLISFKPAAKTATHVTATKHIAPPQTKAPAFCRLTLVDHNGHSIKLATTNLHATDKMIQANFDTGERLTITFTSFRIVAGHFVADSPRSTNPQIQFITPRHLYRLTGAVTITSSKVVAGNFSHLISDDDDHITLIAGSFSL